MINLKNLIEEVAFELALNRVCTEAIAVASVTLDPEEARSDLVKMWHSDLSEEGINLRMRYRQDAAISLKSIVHFLGKDFAEIAKDETIILSESRSPGSFGKVRADHGKLIADLILKHTEQISDQAGAYITKL